MQYKLYICRRNETANLLNMLVLHSWKYGYMHLVCHRNLGIDACMLSTHIKERSTFDEAIVVISLPETKYQVGYYYGNGPVSVVRPQFEVYL